MSEAADVVAGAPHPRDAPRLVGQAEAEAALLDAMRSGRMHHAWLLTGPRGVGKATLAYRAARALLARDRPTSLEVPADDPVARRIRAGSEPRLAVLRREWDPSRDRLPDVIGVEAVRSVTAAMNLTAADGGRRAIVVDCADEMNVQAANALLKLLEEPPDRTTFFMVAHRPSALLPTIRSRCRVLRLRPLGAADMARVLDRPDAGALAALAGGSVGEALRLAEGGGGELYARIVDLLRGMPGMDRPTAIALAGDASGRGSEARRDMTLRLLEIALARLATTGAAGAPRPEAAPGEAEAMGRLSPGPAAGRLWAEAQLATSDRARVGLAVNLDPATLLLDMLRRIDETAARAVRPARRPDDDPTADAAPR